MSFPINVPFLGIQISEGAFVVSAFVIGIFVMCCLVLLLASKLQRGD